MAQYEFWTHGVNVQIEYPDRIVGITGNKHAEPRRSGWGTLIYQKENTTNWFHFAIPTPVIINNQEATLRFIRFRAEINETARIDRIHFRHDNRIILSREFNITNCSVDETIQSPKTIIRRSLALCVHISFLPGDARGMVIFKGAGGGFGLG
ncbi:MAG: hypothetical protein JRF31_02975 [Deltaproteobacteria bacterium]|nr:hypothetical protein [Deltaproteobacteria bacterium]MBW1957125.1 hypothetical protein [Deltaproteobacteria bacterium]MBW2012528.1 hypothetical protein [Deltaproteobacteria bacterium]MBW2087820.1 hypothetical protein [Deltaproteobacteria bacterium]MBW2319815.1 hypothetical protein [Deltaproteobacteria bacterium]